MKDDVSKSLIISNFQKKISKSPDFSGAKGPLQITCMEFSMYIIPGKKSAFWQLVAVVIEPKTMQSGKKRRKISQKSKEKFA